MFVPEVAPMDLLFYLHFSACYSNHTRSGMHCSYMQKLFLFFSLLSAFLIPHFFICNKIFISHLSKKQLFHFFLFYFQPLWFVKLFIHVCKITDMEETEIIALANYDGYWPFLLHFKILCVCMCTRVRVLLTCTWNSIWQSCHTNPPKMIQKTL